MRATGATALTVPFWRALEAQADGPPIKRVIFFCEPNGTVQSHWRCRDGEGSAFELSHILSPLQSLKDDLIVLGDITGINVDIHQFSSHLTGLTALPVGDNDSTGAGISVDQFIADHIGGETRFPSLQLGVQVGRDDGKGRVSFRGPREPLPPEENPYNAFERIFGEFTGGSDTLARLQTERRSVLDHVQSDIGRLLSRVGREDRARLEAHLESVRAVETQFERAGGECAAPTLERAVDVWDFANGDRISRMQIDVLVAAMRCDLTRVATLQYAHAAGHNSYPFLGFSDGHHDLHHEPNENTEARDKLVRVQRWFMEELAYLATALKNTPEGDGTMLDNTVIVGFNELAQGNTHLTRGIPIVLIGQCGGFFRTGRALTLTQPERYRGWPLNALLVTLCQAFGIETDSFGDPAERGGLPL